jgi:hypothetical protein
VISGDWGKAWIVIKIKWKTHTVGTIPKSNIKIVERGKFDNPSTQLP